MALVTEFGDADAEHHNARLARDLGLRTARHAVQFAPDPHVTRMRDLGVLPDPRQAGRPRHAARR